MVSVTINPIDVERSPLPSGDLGLPEWARTALEFINDASHAGEAVSPVPDEVTFLVEGVHLNDRAGAVVLDLVEHFLRKTGS